MLHVSDRSRPRPGAGQATMTKPATAKPGEVKPGTAKPAAAEQAKPEQAKPEQATTEQAVTRRLVTRQLLAPARYRDPLGPARYRDPRDLVGLIAGAGVLGAALITIAAAHGSVLGPAATVSFGRSRRPRSNWALSATTIVETLMMSAPTLIGRMKPIGASSPAATGMAIAL